MFPDGFTDVRSGSPLAGSGPRDCSSVTCHLYLYHMLIVKHVEAVLNKYFADDIVHHSATLKMNQVNGSPNIQAESAPL